jgi:hypothetical protein
MYAWIWLFGFNSISVAQSCWCDSSRILLGFYRYQLSCIPTPFSILHHRHSTHVLIFAGSVNAWAGVLFLIFYTKLPNSLKRAILVVWQTRKFKNVTKYKTGFASSQTATSAWKWDLYCVPPEVLFASRKINTSGNKAKDTEPLATRVGLRVRSKIYI